MKLWTKQKRISQLRKGLAGFRVFMKMTLENQDRLPVGEQVKVTESDLVCTKERYLNTAVATTFAPDMAVVPLSKLQKE